MSHSRIFLTGATGFLGSHLAKRLIEKGIHVVAWKRRTSSLSRLQTFLKHIEFIDIDDSGNIDHRKLKHIDAIIHTACSYGRCGESIETIFRVNTKLPLMLLEASIKCSVPKFINTATVLPKHLNAYALSKAHFSDWAQFLCQDNARFIDVRLEHMFGPGDHPSKFTTNIIRQCLANVESLSLTAGEQRRDFIYIDDVVDAYILLLGEENFSSSYNPVSLGSSDAVTIRHFVELTKKLARSRTSLCFGEMPYRAGEIMYSQADTGFLRTLGWRPKYSLEEGLAATICAERLAINVTKKQ